MGPDASLQPVGVVIDGDIRMPPRAQFAAVKALDSGQFGRRLLLWSELTVLLARCPLRRNTEPGN